MRTLYTAYCTRAGTVNLRNRAEVRFEFREPDGVTFGLDYGEVGRVSTFLTGSAVQYDISSVPIDASVVRARLVMTANTSDSSVFGSNIGRYFDGIAPTQDSVTSAPHNHFKYASRARDTASTQLALTSTTTNFTLFVSTADGVTSPGQALVLTTAGNGLLGSVSMHLARVPGPASGTCRAKVYSAQGTASRYSRGELLTVSDTRPISDLSVIGFGTTEIEFTLPNPLAITSGQVLIVEIEFDPVPTVFAVGAGGDTGFIFADENALNFGTTLEAFATAVYASGVELFFTNGGLQSGDDFVWPTFIAGDQVTLGDTLYSPDVTITEFTSWVQDGLDGRGDGNRIAFRFATDVFGGDPPANGEKRQWRSADHATPQIVDGQSFFGTVLQIEYTLPGPVKAFPARARPAVAHGEISARPAVSSPAEPRARAAVFSSEKARARPLVMHDEIAARPTVSSATPPRARAVVRSTLEARARPGVSHSEVNARPTVTSPAEPGARAAVRTPEEARARSAINRGEARARPAVRRP